MSKVVCITGMHRSGTSLLASWLYEQGLKIDSGGLVDSAVGNKKGHFEDKEIMEFQSSLILKSKVNSKGWIVDESLKFTGFEEGILGILKKRELIDQWGWKDPRSVLLLDEWNEVLKELKFVFIWRSVNEVVDSLMKRKKKSKHPLDQISLIDAYRTWVFYNKRIIDFYRTNEEKCILVKLDGFLKNDEAVFRVLTDKLKLELNYTKLDKVFESTLLSGKSNTYTRNILRSYFKTSKIEQELLELSIKYA